MTAAGEVAGAVRIAPKPALLVRIWRSSTFRRLLRHKLFMVGLILVFIVAFVGAFAELITTADPLRIGMRNRFKPPGEDGFIFGTDNFGRSQWARIAYGARLSMLIGLGVVAINIVFGTLIGAVAGYYRQFDNMLMRVTDAFMAFPAVLLAIGITAALGPSMVNAIIALGAVYAPRTARIVRASVLVVREMEFVQAALASGASHSRVLWRHVMPNCMAPLIVQVTFIFAYAVLSEGILSFLGLGVEPPAPTWGNIIADGRQYMREAAWITLIPGIWLAITVLGLNLLGDGLRDVLDPRLKVQQG
jgi:peptide/nickel transport system permease protein